jgi:hypothetical protein
MGGVVLFESFAQLVDLDGQLRVHLGLDLISVVNEVRGELRVCGHRDSGGWDYQAQRRGAVVGCD